MALRGAHFCLKVFRAEDLPQSEWVPLLGDCEGGPWAGLPQVPAGRRGRGWPPGSLPAASWPGFCTQGSSRSVPAQLPFCSAVWGRLTPSVGFLRVLGLFLGEKQSPAPFSDAEKHQEKHLLMLKWHQHHFNSTVCLRLAPTDSPSLL